MAELFIRSPGPIAAIGDALAERLKVIFPAEKFEHNFVPARADAAVWNKLLRRTPFVGIGFAMVEGNKGGSSSQFVGTTVWPIFLATRNEAGPRQRFFGDKLAPGSLQMTQAAIGVLHGRVLSAGGVKLGTVSIQSAANSFAEDWKDDTVALITLEATVPVTLPVTAVLGGEDTIPADIDGAKITWSFDGGATTPLTDQTTGTSA